MIAQWLAKKLEPSIGRCCRALFRRSAPGFGVGKELTLDAASADRGCYCVAASFELRLDGDRRLANEIESARARLQNGRSIQGLIEAANRSNALIGVHLVSGKASENHHFLAVIPRGRCDGC